LFFKVTKILSKSVKIFYKPIQGITISRKWLLNTKAVACERLNAILGQPLLNNKLWKDRPMKCLKQVMRKLIKLWTLERIVQSESFNTSTRSLLLNRNDSCCEEKYEIKFELRKNV